MCYPSLHTVSMQFLLFTCLYFYMQSNQTIIEYNFDSFMCQLYHGSSNTARPSPTNDTWTSLDMLSYERGGVSMTWGYLLPYNIP